MEAQEYILQKQNIYKHFLSFIENSEDYEANFQNFVNDLNLFNTQSKHEELYLILRMINKISKNHHRCPNFFNKIEKFLSHFEKDIKQTFTNFELFNIFKNNKRVLLSLITQKVLTFDDQVLNYITNNKKFNKYGYGQYFSPEMQTNTSQSIENFEEKRQTGENESYICTLIRKDSVEEFISHVNQSNISYTEQIGRSTFETNSYLLSKDSVSMIEYAAFFGSVQIFQYLRMNNVELTPSLWLFAIHGRSNEIIHILEENHVSPNDATYEEILEESIKCHHNEISYYIYDYLINQKVEENSLSFEVGQKTMKNDGNQITKALLKRKGKIDEISCYYGRNIVAYCFHYNNYEFMPADLSNNFFIYYAVQYNYFTLVKLLLENAKIDINARVISKINIFFYYVS